jgi:ribosomal protein S18 acetylase RimI-like enzyme
MTPATTLDILPMPAFTMPAFFRCACVGARVGMRADHAEIIPSACRGQQLLSIVTYHLSHFDGIKVLWHEAFPNDPPWNAAEIAIPAKLKIQPKLFLVAIDQDLVVGSIMAGYDGHRGWLYAAAVLQSHQRQGIGTALVREAETLLSGMGCTKINLQVRSSNTAVTRFYNSLGYEIEERVSMGKRLRQ